MNKALRFVWLSLLTLICGVASAGTVVFDPTVDTPVGGVLSKNGITFSVKTGNSTLDPQTNPNDGKVCYVLKPSSTFEITAVAPAGNITAITCEYTSTNGSIYQEVTYKVLNSGQKFQITDEGGVSSFLMGSYGTTVYLTKLSVEFIGGEDPGPGGDEDPTTTIAQLAAGKTSLASANIKFTNAQVVYAEGNNYVVRENNQAIDIMGSSLGLSQGDKLNGTVKLNVTYTQKSQWAGFGILTTSDIPNETNLEKLEVTSGSSTELEPIHCATVQELKQHPGDLVYLENLMCYGTYCTFGGGYVYLSNMEEKGIERNKKYNAILWFNGDMYSTPLAKVIEAELVITTLNAPAISGETAFEESTTVTINSDVSVAAIYYTTNDDEPTTSSTLYTGPFTLTESATVKAIAAYKTVVSPVATCVFEKIDANVTKTIAELAATQNNYPMVKVSFNNAQVVYADGKNFILREDGKALDVMNSSLNLQQGAYYQGTVRLKVTCENGILKASDVEGKTDDTDITLVSQPTTKPNPIVCTVAEAAQHPGDLLKLEGQSVTVWYSSYYVYQEVGNDFAYVYFSNGKDKGLQNGKQYDLTVWYDEYNSDPWATIVEATPAITHLDAPTISGDEVFMESTNVTITSAVDVDGVAIYYTLDGKDPTTASQPYNAPFLLTETTTVKAIAVYKSITSDVASLRFEKFDANAPRTIAELASIKADLASVTVSFADAQVVYGEENNYILRENIEGKYYALDVLNTQLPFKVGATVSGTVKLKVAFKANPAENNGVLSTADVAETSDADLNISQSTSVVPIPLEVSVLKAKDYPGDLLVVKDGKWYPNNGNPQLYNYNSAGTEYDVYVSNHSLYSFEDFSQPDVMLWYNDVYTDGKSPLAKIIGEKETAEYKVTEVGWATFIVPFDYDKPEGLTIYECTSVNEDGKLVVEERDYLKANTPYLLKGGEANQILEGYAAKHADTYTNDVMTGVYSDQEAPANSYILLNHPDEAGLAFYFVPDGITAYVDANRCYVNPRAGGFKSILFPDDETNGVTNANATETTLVDVYTTAGVKVKHQVEKGKALNDLPAGLYIINNKKIVKK